MEAKPEPTSLILVVVINNKRDFEIARMLGWYRIPQRSAPKVIAVDYLAFYLTAAFGDEKWRIQYIAPVRGHELVTRAELLKDELDHPRANQMYYKIQLGPLMRLSHPIVADKWRRLTFLYTTGDHLRTSHTLNELVLSSEERPIFWQSLRERANQYQAFNYDQGEGAEIDPEILPLLLGIFKIDENGGF